VAGGQVRIPANMGAEALRAALQILDGDAVSQFIEIPLTLILPESVDTRGLDATSFLEDREGLPSE